jgi:hypothetical protein
MKSSAVCATSRQSLSMVRACPRPGISTNSVTPELCCRLLYPAGRWCAGRCGRSRRRRSSTGTGRGSRCRPRSLVVLSRHGLRGAHGPSLTRPAARIPRLRPFTKDRVNNLSNNGLSRSTQKARAVMLTTSKNRSHRIGQRLAQSRRSKLDSTRLNETCAIVWETFQPVNHQFVMFFWRPVSTHAVHKVLEI